MGLLDSVASAAGGMLELVRAGADRLLTPPSEARSTPGLDSGWSVLLDLVDANRPTALPALGALQRSIAVYRSVMVTAGALGSMPLKSYRNVKDGRVETNNALLVTPHRELSPVEWVELVGTHLLSWGNAYLLIERNEAGVPIYLDPIPPLSVQVHRVTPSEANTSGRVYTVSLLQADGTTGESKTLTNRDLLHIPYISLDGIFGLPPIGAARVAAGSAVAAEEYAARLWTAGSLAQGILRADGDIDEATATAIKQKWAEKMQGTANARDVAVLAGVTFEQLTIPNDDAQFLQSRQFDAASIYGLFGLDEHGNPTRPHDWLKFTLLPLMRRIEQRVSRVLPRGQFAEFSQEGLLRADVAVRYPSYAIGLQNGWLSVAEIRELENLPKIDGTDQLAPLAPGTGTPNAHLLPNREDG